MIALGIVALVLAFWHIFTLVLALGIVALVLAFWGKLALVIALGIVALVIAFLGALVLTFGHELTFVGIVTLVLALLGILALVLTIGHKLALVVILALVRAFLGIFALVFAFDIVTLVLSFGIAALELALGHILALIITWSKFALVFCVRGKATLVVALSIVFLIFALRDKFALRIVALVLALSGVLVLIRAFRQEFTLVRTLRQELTLVRALGQKLVLEIAFRHKPGTLRRIKRRFKLCSSLAKRLVQLFVVLRRVQKRVPAHIRILLGIRVLLLTIGSELISALFVALLIFEARIVALVCTPAPVVRSLLICSLLICGLRGLLHIWHWTSPLRPALGIKGVCLLLHQGPCGLRLDALARVLRVHRCACVCTWRTCVLRGHGMRLARRRCAKCRRRRRLRSCVMPRRARRWRGNSSGRRGLVRLRHPRRRLLQAKHIRWWLTKQRRCLVDFGWLRRRPLCSRLDQLCWLRWLGWLRRRRRTRTRTWLFHRCGTWCGRPRRTLAVSRRCCHGRPS